ncbi:hypothetical protein CCMSSC00406_0009556 [Pleurotus cornucopiae]|uniref:Uncharacterized protein n=1 Tax=Pleurotus cornucopiae TaxID=5321 RepID=A0ACB7IQ38_PLECO|nr:hypothetical protein CCMSSC00406_0009556 [Pleurotus cornucopiae]
MRGTPIVLPRYHREERCQSTPASCQHNENDGAGLVRRWDIRQGSRGLYDLGTKLQGQSLWRPSFSSRVPWSRFHHHRDLPSSPESLHTRRSLAEECEGEKLASVSAKNAEDDQEKGRGPNGGGCETRTKDNTHGNTHGRKPRRRYASTTASTPPPPTSPPVGLWPCLPAANHDLRHIATDSTRRRPFGYEARSLRRDTHVSTRDERRDGT